MSHTTTIGQILFADEDALRSAVDELQARGVDCSLVEHIRPRAYYSNQLDEAPLVLKLNKSRYDVGFYPVEGEDHMVAKTDLWGGDVAGQLGVEEEEGVSPTQAAIGKLTQAYATHATMNQIVRQGGTVTRIDDADGTVRLVAQV